ncbi:hypothetical protein DN748_00530 [Sinomicrobium soli]|nr:hypothetical protein DN748_00530 [Sinomicrobium sp. N-1-3-6]
MHPAGERNRYFCPWSRNKCEYGDRKTGKNSALFEAGGFEVNGGVTCLPAVRAVRFRISFDTYKRSR